MENTGLISSYLKPTARQILFGKIDEGSTQSELTTISQVDRAHLVMLAESGLIEPVKICRLLREIEKLRNCHFDSLLGRTTPRGLYLAYEDYLIEKLGLDIGGILQTGRSRNDLNATTLKLRLRKPYLRLLSETLRLQAILLRRARRFKEVVMPIYTHYQAAVPITYGHYLLGIASALGRDIAHLTAINTDINQCPLGAGAVGGTSLSINSARTASLLGFNAPVLHSIDAVASRDLVLRLLANATFIGITLSRLASDLQLWTTAEFGFLSLSDELVGSSSMMPQKRNPFLLEHVQGRSTSALGALVTASMAIHAKPFSNSIAVGTEAVSHLWKPLQDMIEAVILARLVAADAVPNKENMLKRAVDGYTSATALANQLVIEGGMPFREAHRTVGTIIRSALQNGHKPLQSEAEQFNLKTSLEGLNPSFVAKNANYGGGPGIASMDTCLKSVHHQWAELMRRKSEQTQKWQMADMALDAAVQKLCTN